MTAPSHGAGRQFESAPTHSIAAIALTRAFDSARGYASQQVHRERSGLTQNTRTLPPGHRSQSTLYACDGDCTGVMTL